MPRPANEPRFWDKIARKYAASPIGDGEGYERTIAAVRALIKPADSVVEFGAGTGMTALKLAPAAARYVASDFSPEMIAIGREKAAAGEGGANLSFEIAAPDAPPWPDESFDVALAFNLLHLVVARAAALAGIRRVLKPGGLFISKTPCLKEAGLPWALMIPALPLMQALGKAPYVAVFTADQLEPEIAAAGFEIVERARHATRGKDARPFLVARKV